MLNPVTKPDTVSGDQTMPRLDLQQHLRTSKGGPAGAHRPADQQGHRAASAGALAVHRRHAGGRAPRLPVHQRHRCQGPQIRHAGGGRRARGVAARSTRSAWARPVEEIGERLDDRRSPIRSRRCASNGARLPGGRHHRRRAARAGRRPAALPVPVSTPGFDAAPYLTATLASPAIPRPACRTWAPIAPR